MTMQHTLAKEVHAVGVGLHSGNPIHMNLKPAPPRTGIVFVRTDLNGESLQASIEAVDFKRLQMATVLRKGDILIQTTEHLLSALYGAGIDNVFVEIDGSEVPIMDGSAEPFLMLIEEAGIKRQAVPRRLLKVEKPFSITMGDKELSVTPAKDFSISYEIEFDHPLIQRQVKTVAVDGQAYENQIAQARTFGFLRDVNQLKEMGLIKGGSLENAIVLDGDRMLNDALRLKDEFVSHKILDLIGDLFVSGMRFQGHFKAKKAGHEVHAHFLKGLLENADCYSIVCEEEAATEANIPVAAMAKVA